MKIKEEHNCDEMNEAVKILKTFEDYWDVWMKDQENLTETNELLIDINFCPYCGEQLS